MGRGHRKVYAFERMVAFVSKAENELKPTLFDSVSHLSYVPEKNNHDTLMFGGTIEGSNTSVATVPDMCRVSFDLRTIPDEPANRGEELICTFTEKFAKENPDLKIEVAFSSKMEGFTLTEKGELLTTLTQCIEEKIGRKPLQSISSGAFETYLFHKKGIPGLCFGPGSLALAHAPDEFVSINELISVTEIYALTAYRYLL
jgi:acetylornithine deacetylase/succinyl-diaminopimelate desuccinylase-like protein